jgi:DNA-binding MarR family transcriptional regulator
MITDRQRALLVAVRDKWDEADRGPTVKELSKSLELSYAGTAYNIRTAVGAGWLQRVPGRHHDLRLTEDGLAAL